MPNLYQNKYDSPLHSLNPITNLVILICIFFLIIIFPNLLFSILLLIFIIIMYGVAGIEFKMILKKGRFLFYFSAIIFLIQVLFTSGGTVLFTLIPNSSPILPGLFPITTNGLLLGTSMTLRFLIIVLASFLFVSITDPNQFAYSLMQIGLPYRYGFMLVTSLRFLPQFEIESNTVKKAQLSRGIKLEKHGIRGIYNNVKYTLRPLIVSALQKAETTARSMEGRGFGLYKNRTFIDRNLMRKKDIVTIAIAISITIIFIISFTFIYNQKDLIQILLS